MGWLCIDNRLNRVLGWICLICQWVWAQVELRQRGRIHFPLRKPSHYPLMGGMSHMTPPSMSIHWFSCLHTQTYIHTHTYLILVSYLSTAPFDLSSYHFLCFLSVFFFFSCLLIFHLHLFPLISSHVFLTVFSPSVLLWFLPLSVLSKCSGLQNNPLCDFSLFYLGFGNVCFIHHDSPIPGKLKRTISWPTCISLWNRK